MRSPPSARPASSGWVISLIAPDADFRAFLVSIVDALIADIHAFGRVHQQHDRPPDVLLEFEREHRAAGAAAGSGRSSVKRSPASSRRFRAGQRAVRLLPPVGPPDECRRAASPRRPASRAQSMFLKCRLIEVTRWTSSAFTPKSRSRGAFHFEALNLPARNVSQHATAERQRREDRPELACHCRSSRALPAYRSPGPNGSPRSPARASSIPCPESGSSLDSSGSGCAAKLSFAGGSRVDGDAVNARVIGVPVAQQRRAVDQAPRLLLSPLSGRDPRRCRPSSPCRATPASRRVGEASRPRGYSALRPAALPAGPAPAASAAQTPDAPGRSFHAVFAVLENSITLPASPGPLDDCRRPILVIQHRHRLARLLALLWQRIERPIP